MVARQEFEDFLSKINLNGYREKYRPIKIVEMDLPKDIQAIGLLYEIYWAKRELLSFDAFYKAYLEEKRKLLEEFRKKIQMCEDCFYRGLPARIYRTWASLITQIQAGYAAEDVYGKGNVDMSEELDHEGADIRVSYKKKKINYQVKKESFSREVRKEKKKKVPLDGEFIDLNYQVPSQDIFNNPKKKNGEYKAAYDRFIKNKTLKRLPNGFVIFTEVAFKPKKDEIDQES